MTRQELLLTKYGEMMDMLACRAIENGAAEPKRKKQWTYDEAIALE